MQFGRVLDGAPDVDVLSDERVLDGDAVGLVVEFRRLPDPVDLVGRHLVDGDRPAAACGPDRRDADAAADDSDAVAGLDRLLDALDKGLLVVGMFDGLVEVPQLLDRHVVEVADLPRGNRPDGLVVEGPDAVHQGRPRRAHWLLRGARRYYLLTPYQDDRVTQLIYKDGL